ncbi:DNA-binding transcriptional regulator, MerR family [Pseudonocardia ammonioxydans]|uniref:DNA-binding transcriptional regulator, MerR family n=1 Tax=Pseudonocardia ammonioxydans TaxID=260086 RepID=A0A1I5G5I2_PSUAM|nr:MerR family transcriptional regulator [Pseudonocardia ammonioxydans]SFO31093.1 DNA-binding transcriptional regulator, MerR family [Pseudonocardia ammonioxydans]
MVRYRISQLAERVGLPATTLRYYEARGLLPAQRTAGGYRSYDDHDIERVRFIATTKNLGLSLTRIRDLLRVRENGACRDVRDRLLPLIAEQLAELEARAQDLHELRRHLTAAQDRLRTLPAREVPCDPGCRAVMGERAGSSGLPADAGGTAPIACSLPAADHAPRLARWRAVLAGAVPRQLDDATLRVDIPPERIGEVAVLLVDEVACCPFFRFSLTVTHGGAYLDATAPAGAGPLLDELFSAGPDHARRT